MRAGYVIVKVSDNYRKAYATGQAILARGRIAEKAKLASLSAMRNPFDELDNNIPVLYGRIQARFLVYFDNQAQALIMVEHDQW